MIASRGRHPSRMAYISSSRTFCFGSCRAVASHARPSTLSSRTPPRLSPPRSLLSSANMSTFGSFRVPTITNEPNYIFAKGSAQRDGLMAAIKSAKKKGTLNIPLLIGGQEIMTSYTGQQLCPADHKTVVARYAQADPQAVETAMAAAMAAKPAWEALAFADRAAIFLKAADLISTKYRYEMLAATMVGQGKNAWQAEIDAAAELVDFLRFNVQYAAEIYATQPALHSPGVWNRLEYRPLEGFVYAVTPFNFTAIGGNLVAAPALMGNVVVWKPSDYAIASNYLLLQILLEAGLPRDVVQFVPGEPEAVTRQVLGHRDFGALHYTGSSAVFRSLFGQVGAGVAAGRYRSYPRMVGETGGKNFHLLHPSADVESAVVQTVRGAFEYSGQKCSATSRLYVPASLWPRVRARLVEETERLTMGDNTEFATFVGPVIHRASFDRLTGAIDAAKSDPELELVTGGTYDGSRGYFVRPTIYECKNPRHPLLSTELFGPVLAVYVWDDSGSAEAFADACALVDGQSEYGLTGSVFATDRTAVRLAEEALRHASGMFYINCKSTGARVHEQPFGGSRASGTNAKAGSRDHLLHFVSTRTIKEEFLPTTVVGYPSNE